MRLHFDIDIIPGDDRLSANGANLNFDVNDSETLRADVDVDKTRINGFVELSEAGDQTNGTLLHVFERIREWAARDCTTQTDANTEGLEKRTIDTMCDFLSTEVLSV